MQMYLNWVEGIRPTPAQNVSCYRTEDTAGTQISLKTQHPSRETQHEPNTLNHTISAEPSVTPALDLPLVCLKHVTCSSRVTDYPYVWATMCVFVHSRFHASPSMDIFPRNRWFNLTKAWLTDSLMRTAHKNWKISLKTACWSDFSV